MSGDEGGEDGDVPPSCEGGSAGVGVDPESHADVNVEVRVHFFERLLLSRQ